MPRAASIFVLRGNSDAEAPGGVTAYDLDAGQKRDYLERRLKGEWRIEKRRTKTVGVPKFASEQEEAKWWARSKGRQFLKEQSGQRATKPSAGSELVAKLVKASSVQIGLRLLSPDLAKAREIAECKRIGYHTLLKVIVHEGLRRADRQAS